LIGRLTGFLAVTKSPSARSDNLIFAYGEVPRALDLSTRIHPPDGRRRAHPAGQPGTDARGSSTAATRRATDLAEYLVQTLGVDYRTAYVVVGQTVRAASRAGVRAAGSPGR